MKLHNVYQITDKIISKSHPHCHQLINCCKSQSINEQVYFSVFKLLVEISNFFYCSKEHFFVLLFHHRLTATVEHTWIITMCKEIQVNSQWYAEYILEKFFDICRILSQKNLELRIY